MSGDELVARAARRRSRWGAFLDVLSLSTAYARWSEIMQLYERAAILYALEERTVDVVVAYENAATCARFAGLHSVAADNLHAAARACRGLGDRGAVMAANLYRRSADMHVANGHAYHAADMYVRAAQAGGDPAGVRDAYRRAAILYESIGSAQQAQACRQHMGTAVSP